MAIIGYARCSSIEQSFDLQVDRLREAGAAQVFSEKRSAANTKGRHELEAALSSLRPGDTLLVTKLDRAARNVLDLLKIIERIKAAGADFRCLDQPIATDGPLGSLMLTVLGAFAQFENDIRKERQLEGIAAAKARGAFDASRFPIAPGVLSHCSRMLSQGLSYVQVSERTGVSVDTLQRRWPKYKTLTPEARSRAQKRRRAGRSREPKTPVGTILRAQAEASEAPESWSSAARHMETQFGTAAAARGMAGHAGLLPDGPPFSSAYLEPGQVWRDVETGATVVMQGNPSPDDPVLTPTWGSAPEVDVTASTRAPKRRGLFGVFGR